MSLTIARGMKKGQGERGREGLLQFQPLVSMCRSRGQALMTC